jgi:hypothetical protein
MNKLMMYNLNIMLTLMNYMLNLNTNDLAGQSELTVLLSIVQESWSICLLSD